MSKSPAEEYAERLSGAVDVESVDTIFAAGPDFPSLSQGKIHFYSTTTVNHRIKLSHIFYRAKNHEITDGMVILGDLDPDEYTKGEAFDEVEKLVRGVGVPSDDPDDFVIRGQDNTNSMMGNILSGVSEGTPLQHRFNGISINIQPVHSWDADEFIPFMSELQEEYTRRFY